MSNKIIDPHVHFLNLQQGQYSWLLGDTPPQWPNLAKIKRPITTEQLIQSSDFELAGLVHIEAGFDNYAPINELHWLASHLSTLPYKAISYTRIDQHTALFCDALSKLTHPSLSGIRDITEGDDAERLLSANCYHNLAALNHLKLHFEAQFELENCAVVKRVAHYAEQFKQLLIVINHAGLPRNVHAWQQGIALLAKHNNVVIKFSGFELLSLNREQQALCFSMLLQHFGTQRVMFASNFPVCQINASYNELWHAHYKLCDKPSIWQQLSFKNAKHYYQV